MLDSIGSHYDLLAGGSALLFLLILALLAVEDAFRRRRRSPGETAPARQAQEVIAG